MREVLEPLSGIAVLVFVVSCMAAAGLGLSIPELLAPLRRRWLVAGSRHVDRELGRRRAVDVAWTIREDALGANPYHELRTDEMVQQDVVGRDFFREVAQFANKEDLRKHFRRFLVSSRPADSFGFECEYREGPVKTRITMTRGHETENDRTASIVIMDIIKSGN